MEATNIEQFEKNLAENQFIGGYLILSHSFILYLDNNQPLLIKKLMKT